MPTPAPITFNWELCNYILYKRKFHKKIQVYNTFTDRVTDIHFMFW